MSGWIKLEKDLYTDPRIRRMAKALDKRLVLFDQPDDYDPCNAAALPAVTLVIGALAVLWFHADTHLREGDILDLGADEIDDLVSIKGFCALCPSDWLQIIDGNSVKLPYFHIHNGIEARKKAQTQKRVNNHRNSMQRSSVTPRNATALPDQTRQDLDQREEKKARASRSARLPEDFDLTTERRKFCEAERKDAEREFAKFTDYWRSASGAKARKLDWDATWRNWCRSDFSAGKPANGHGRLSVASLTAWERLLASDGADRAGKAQNALESIGGWQRVLMRSTFDAPKIKAEFCNAYGE